MNFRKVRRGITIVLLIILLILFFPFFPSHRQSAYNFDFTTGSPSLLLKETTKRLSLYKALYVLDYMYIEYDWVEDQPHTTTVTFGFSRYLGFDVYDAICFTYDGHSIETNYMREEAKTIYDDLYDSKAFIGYKEISPSRYIGQSTLSFDRTVADLLDENISEDFPGCIDIDEQMNTIVLSEIFSD